MISHISEVKQFLVSCGSFGFQPSLWLVKSKGFYSSPKICHLKAKASTLRFRSAVHLFVCDKADPAVGGFTHRGALVVSKNSPVHGSISSISSMVHVLFVLFMKFNLLVTGPCQHSTVIILTTQVHYRYFVDHFGRWKGWRFWLDTSSLPGAPHAGRTISADITREARQ